MHAKQFFDSLLLFLDEFGAEPKDDDDFVDAEGDGWGGEDELELEVSRFMLGELLEF